MEKIWRSRKTKAPVHAQTSKKGLRVKKRRIRRSQLSGRLFWHRGMAGGHLWDDRITPPEDAGDRKATPNSLSLKKE